MKYFIDRITSEVLAFELDGSQDTFIRPDLEPLDAAELALTLAAQAAAAITPEQTLLTVNARRDELLTVATLRLAPLQDAVDEENATDDEVLRLKQWKKYRIALNRIEQQENYPIHIDWPSLPGEDASV